MSTSSIPQRCSPAFGGAGTPRLPGHADERRTASLAWPVDQAIAEIRSRSALHFDPQAVEAFLAVQRGTMDLALPA